MIANLILSALLLCLNFAPATQVTTHTDLVHKPSGFVFPKQVDALERSDRDRFDPDNETAWVVYGFFKVTDRPTMTVVQVVVYPREGFGLVDEGKGRREACETEKQKGQSEITEGRVKLEKNGQTYDGVELRYSAGGEVDRIDYRLVIFQVGEWFVRFSVRTDQAPGEDNAKVSAEFQKAFPFPSSSKP